MARPQLVRQHHPVRSIGQPIAHAPEADLRNLGPSYEWRDYFQGVTLLGKAKKRHTGYISRAFKAEADGRYKFAVAAPVYDISTACSSPDPPTSCWINVVMATIGTDSAWGGHAPA